MNYNISSSSFEQPLLKPLLEHLAQYFNSIGTRFFIIGATARDIIMDAHGEKSGRATRDLDIAIAIPDWSKFTQIETELIQFDDFKKDTNQKQRFIYKDLYQVDIVPFGEIMKMGDKIFWPPEEEIAMSVLGFSEVDKATKTVIIDEDLTLNIASLAGIFLLKVVAWNDRHLSGNKDADDMAFIIRNYFIINEDRIVQDHFDLYHDENFSTLTAGASLIGRDIAEIMKDAAITKQKIESILNVELQKKEESKLINQILETNRAFKYEETLKCLQNIINGLNE